MPKRHSTSQPSESKSKKRRLNFHLSAKNKEKISEKLLLVKGFAEHYAAWQKEWERTYGTKFPHDMDDVIELAVCAGLDPNRIFDGKWKYADVFPIIQGYLRRQQQQAQLQAEQESRKPTAEDAKRPIEATPSGFILNGRHYSLTGKPLAVLNVLLASQRREAKADTIYEKCWPDDTADNPRQVVLNAVTQLRKALQKAMRRQGIKQDPITSTGKGKDLTYRLNLPQ
ncbi:MAG: hypothetical protein KatS3mg105_4406 [Gemmatales bacterium]|nr:MAG: hypothetical protein KatS3mg105_3288 [Gemmatales bacterium]GIW82599.1 MAG: hypothetical protein KatS3mg105_4406 [Gemmatales bacterium]